MHLESSTLLQNKILSSLVKSNTPFLSVQAASLSSIAKSSPDTLVSDSLTGVGVGGVCDRKICRPVTLVNELVTR